MSNTVDPVAVARAVASLSALADRYVRAHAHHGGGAVQELHTLRLSHDALGVVLGMTPKDAWLTRFNEGLDKLLEQLRLIGDVLTEDQLVGAYHVVNALPAGYEEAWELIDGLMEQRGYVRPERVARTQNERTEAGT